MVASLFLNLRSQFLDKDIGGTDASAIPANKQHYSQQLQRLFLPPWSNTHRSQESQELPMSCGLLAQPSRNLCHVLVSSGGWGGGHSHCRCREHGPHSKEAQQHQASLFPSRRSVSTKYAYRGNEKTRGHGTEVVAGDTSSDLEV